MWNVSEAVSWEKKEKQVAHGFGMLSCLQTSVLEAACFRSQREMANVWYQKYMKEWRLL